MGAAEPVVVAWPFTSDLPHALVERVAELLRGGRGPAVVLDVGVVAEPDVGTVGALLRLQLAARRHGGHIELLHAPEPLRELIRLVGVAVELPLHQAVRLGLPDGEREPSMSPRSGSGSATVP